MCIGVVRGIAELDGLLYVVCELSSVIHVFDTASYRRLEDIRVFQMDDPNDIVACTATGQLYIADSRTKMPGAIGCVWKVKPSRKVMMWLLRGGVNPYSLSVRDGRVLVTPLNRKQLLIYNSEQQLRKRIPLPRGLEPRHAVETGHRTVVYGTSSSSSSSSISSI